MTEVLPKQRGSRNRRWLWKLAVLSAILIAIVIVPFVLFGEELEAYTRSFLQGSSSAALVAAAGIGLLIADVLLPIPSSVVSSALGVLLGLPLGLIAAAVGLTLGCAVGYGLGRWLGHDYAKREMGEADFSRLERSVNRYGLAMLAVCRPVPVLAEASVIAAGVLGMRVVPVMLVTGLANIGVALVYVGLGSAAEGPMGIALAFCAAIIIPGIALLIAKMIRQDGKNP
ncbi:MAG: TVP38/TMEM64 family protein [Methyloligella sp. ZOD6]